ncbi:alpha/beta fold hydrolase [Tsukamurella spumae]|uniref:Alpha/beta fold hydrolase n=1 Tax=Tsukamurella spumae TaxID=44753 RepID=A0A846X240_9ACTN|nr:alpha/beta hydrolase [Tsukamurella spumae]NKY19364.1 alpha/beta fold hydrolase [Tsukamurella spumae]
MATPTLVLLHGVGLDHTVWEPVIALLGDRFRIVAPDLPGHGDGATVPEGVTLADLAETVAARVPPGSHVVGFSLGALIAQYLAVRRRPLVASLTSVSSVCRRTEGERAAVLGRLATAESDPTAGTAASLERWYRGTDVPQSLIEATRNVLENNDPVSFVRCYRVFATGDADVGPLLGEIAVPALAITGELDPGSTPEMTYRLAEAIPGCSPVVVPGARHMLPVQNPTALVGALTDFLGRNFHV